MRRALVAMLALSSCTEPPRVYDVHLASIADAAGEGRRSVDVDAARGDSVVIFTDGEPRVVEVALDAAVATFDGADGDAPGWLRPRSIDAATLTVDVTGDGAATVTVFARGAPPPPVVRERSLVWLDPSLLDDRAVIGPGAVFAAAAHAPHGGLLADAWLRRFSTTGHSQRFGPALLADDLAATLGPDPATWDMDQLPFTVTGVHNRIDLAPREGQCGQLRVSMASTHPLYAPLHVIALFRQPAADDDIAPDGSIHCAGTARRWARLSSLSEPEFRAAAAAWLRGVVAADNFVMLESVELTVSPWEWRQWTPRPASGGQPTVLDNPPLFQTVDTARLNVPGTNRDALVAWIAANADDLAARRIVIPERFRAPSAQVAPGVPRTPLQLAGLPDAVATRYPDLASTIETVGCPKCHTTNAEFVQTSRERVLSPFYDRELDARARRLDDLAAGVVLLPPPFGALQ